jgi:hypothetical protein
VIVLFLPWYLLLFGHLFVAAVAGSDLCYSVPSLTVSYMSAYGDELCTQLGGIGTLDACNVRQSSASYATNLNVTLDLRSMGEMLMGTRECSTTTASAASDIASTSARASRADPFYVSLTDLALQLRPNALSAATEFLYGTAAYEDYRAGVKDIAVNASAAAGEVGARLIYALRDDALSCDNIADIVPSVSELVCYTALGPLLWYIGSVYVALWAVFCLGLPAGCCWLRHNSWKEVEDFKAQQAELVRTCYMQRSVASMMQRSLMGSKLGRRLPASGAASVHQLWFGFEDTDGDGGVEDIIDKEKWREAYQNRLAQLARDAGEEGKEEEEEEEGMGFEGDDGNDGEEGKMEGGALSNKGKKNKVRVLLSLKRQSRKVIPISFDEDFHHSDANAGPSKSGKKLDLQAHDDTIGEYLSMSVRYTADS